ncbi:MAG: rod shape-determining protein RodA [Pseudomonadota bacterium]|nr:rod shape-determining protein RodA [Pseudomonadota bacterium]
MSAADFRRTLSREDGFDRRQRWLRRLHLDLPLLVLVLLTAAYGLVVLYSALDGDSVAFQGQLSRLAVAFVMMLIVAQLDIAMLQRWAPVLYGLGIVMLVLVLLVGVQAKGAQRWLGVPGLPRFQPSELMKLAVPLMVASSLADRPLPPTGKTVAWVLALIAAPALLIALQPDLGTAILVAAAGFAVLLLSGLFWRWVLLAGLLGLAALPGLWMVMRDYQRQRVLTLLDPESDPLGAGWNIIQSKIAIGSGGLFGKGLFEGTQSHLNFLPESHTDFILAVLAEELGFLGVLGLLTLYFLLLTRGLYIATQGRDTFARLLAGGLTLTFFTYLFVNVAMVSGLAPVVGVPLPLVSYGGTSALTLLAGFGVLMAVATQPKPVAA